MSERIASWEQDMLMGAYFWVVYDTGEGDALVGFSRAGTARDEDAPGRLSSGTSMCSSPLGTLASQIISSPSRSVMLPLTCG